MQFIKVSRVRGNERTWQFLVIDKENRILSASELPMPAKKDEAPPDLRYFKKAQS